MSGRLHWSLTILLLAGCTAPISTHDTPREEPAPISEPQRRIYRSIATIPIEDARRFLVDEAMPTGDYKPDAPGAPTYYACSTYHRLRGGLNNIAYYVEGDKDQIKKLRLVLNVHDQLNAQAAHAAMAQAANKLLVRGFGSQADLSQLVISGKSGKAAIDEEIGIETRFSFWPTGLGYDLQLIVTDHH